MAIVGISQILMITTLYGSYQLAGQVAAVNVIAYAVCAPILAKLVDAYGQARVMLPAVVVSAGGLFGVMVTAWLQAAPLWLYVFTVIAGGAAGSLGSMVRSRWTGVVKSPAQLHTAFAMESTLDEVVYMSGPVIATLLTTSINPTAGLAVAVVLMLSGSAWLLSQRDTEPPASKRLRPNDAKSSWMDAGSYAGKVEGATSANGDFQPVKRAVILQPVMIALALVYVGAGAVFGAIDMSVVAFTESLGVKSLSGVLLAIFATGSMIAGLLYGARTWTFPLWKLFVGGVLLLAVGTTFIAFASTLGAMALMMLVTGFAVSPTMINVNAMVQRAVPVNRLTEGLTWMSTAMNVGVSLGSAAAGRGIEAGGYDGGFYLVIAFAWLMVVVTLVSIPALREVSRRRRRLIPRDLMRRLGRTRRRKPTV